jgi:hypothetical protein
VRETHLQRRGGEVRTDLEEPLHLVLVAVEVGLAEDGLAFELSEGSLQAEKGGRVRAWVGRGRRAGGHWTSKMSWSFERMTLSVSPLLWTVKWSRESLYSCWRSEKRQRKPLASIS